jgi:hypothetical protein
MSVYKTPRFSKCIRDSKSFKIKIQTLSNHVQSDNEDFLCASGSLLPFAHVHLSQSVYNFSLPLLDITLFSNDLFDESR